MNETIDIRHRMRSSLTKAIQSSDEGVRAWSAWILSQLGVQSTLILIRILKEENAGHCEAVWAAGEIGSDARNMIPLLVQILEESKEMELCYEIIVTLGKMGPAAGETVPNLLQFLHETTQEDLRDEIIGTLGKIGTAEVIHALGRLFHSQNTFLHPEIISALGEIGKTKVDAILSLCLLLPESPIEIQQEIIRTLGDLGSSAKEAIPMLLDILNGPKTELRQTITKALSQIRKNSSPQKNSGDGVSKRSLSLEYYLSSP